MFTIPSNVIVDHLAIAVKDLEEGINFYTRKLGFQLKERRETEGEFSGMLSAVLDGPLTGFTIVLVQGTSRTSQVSRFIDNYGPGVQHIAFLVDDLEKIAIELSKNGITFSTDIINGPGLKQLFTMRDKNSGAMFEFIERVEDKSGFDPGNIQKLFESLEKNDSY